MASWRDTDWIIAEAGRPAVVAVSLTPDEKYAYLLLVEQELRENRLTPTDARADLYKELRSEEHV